VSGASAEPEAVPGPPFRLVGSGLATWIAARLGARRPSRQVIALVGLAWAPLLLLAALESARGGASLRDFLLDLPAHVRFLFALPLLLLAEGAVNRRTAQVAHQFRITGLVRDEDQGRYLAAIDEVHRARDSVRAQAVVTVLAYLAAAIWFRNEVYAGSAGWHAREAGDTLRFLPAGYWYAAVSIPLYQAVLYRWLFLSFAWFRFLWRVSRLDLRLVPTHPDGAAGLAFVGIGLGCFAPVVAAASAVVSAVEGQRILDGASTFDDLKWGFLAAAVLMPALYLAPLLVFARPLALAQRRAQIEYGAFATRFVQRFEDRWVRSGREPDPALAGADIQSLDSLQDAIGVADRMRIVPVDRVTAVTLLVASAVPMAPLIFTKVPPAALLKLLMKLLV
jgi:hypothetical protein